MRRNTERCWQDALSQVQLALEFNPETLEGDPTLHGMTSDSPTKPQFERKLRTAKAQREPAKRAEIADHLAVIGRGTSKRFLWRGIADKRDLIVQASTA